MEVLMTIAGILVVSVFSNNIILSQGIASCQMLGASKKTQTAVAVGLSVTFVNTVASVLCFLVYKALMAAELEYLRILAFIFITATTVQVLNLIVKKASPALYSSLGVYLPLIMTNCAIFQTVSITVNTAIGNGYDMEAGIGLLYTAVYALAIGLGFMTAMILMSGVSQKEDLALVPKPFQGYPIALISLGLIAMAFAGLLFPMIS